MVSLREPNTHTTDVQVMTVIKTLIVANTQLAAGSTDGTGLSQVYIEDRYSLSQGSFPALHLAPGPQQYQRDTNHGNKGQMTIYVDYYDRWETQLIDQDTIRRGLAVDLERMRANMESNDELEYGGAIQTISLLSLSLSPYDGMFDDKLIPGLILIYRRLTLNYNVLMYYV